MRFPFLTAPIAFSLWFLSMDLTPLITGQEEFSWDERRQVSLWFGLAMLVATAFVDRRTREDFAFWGYLFGLMAFWGGLTLNESDSEFAKLVYFLINLALIAFSLLLQRRAFIVFGGLGVFAYLSHLAQVVFKDSLLFPIALSLVGVAIIFAGVKLQKNETRIESALTQWLSKAVRDRLPGARES